MFWGGEIYFVIFKSFSKKHKNNQILRLEHLVHYLMKL